MTQPEYVSIHGGHSGQFCQHAADLLEEIVQEYIRKGFSWIGITEHAPPLSDALQYADEKEAGLTPASLLARFADYMQECRRLQRVYQSRIQIYAGMEIETYTGYGPFVDDLQQRFSPDFIVGSVHFVNDINFDYSLEMYDEAAASVGGVDAMYMEYFDLQFEMIKRLKPAVVGHFDLVRIFDQNYQARLADPRIQQKIRRNLELIKELDLIMDFNLRSLAKGAEEPYIASAILSQARELGIAVVPGDDSHSVASVGNFMEQGIQILQGSGFSTNWRTPVGATI